MCSQVMYFYGMKEKSDSKDMDSLSVDMIYR